MVGWLTQNVPSEVAGGGAVRGRHHVPGDRDSHVLPLLAVTTIAFARSPSAIGATISWICVGVATGGLAITDRFGFAASSATS